MFTQMLCENCSLLTQQILRYERHTNCGMLLYPIPNCHTKQSRRQSFPHGLDFFKYVAVSVQQLSPLLHVCCLYCVCTFYYAHCCLHWFFRDKLCFWVHVFVVRNSDLVLFISCPPMKVFPVVEHVWVS